MSVKLFESDKKPLLFLAIPTWGNHSFLFTQSMLGMQYPSNYSMHQVFLPGMEIGRGRNLLIHKALEAKAKYLLFWDEDVIPPASAVQTLLFHLQNHPEWTVAGALYCTKSDPPEPLIYQEVGQGAYWGFKAGELVRVTGFTGCGFHLFRLADLDAMKSPGWYEDRDPWTGENVRVREFFKTTQEYFKQGDVSARHGGTEDAWFYRMCQEEGLQVWIDTALNSLHLDAATGTAYVLPQNSGTYTKPDAWNATPRVANLGAGQDINPHEVSVDLRGNPTYRCDIRTLPEEWADTFDVVKCNHTLEHFDFGETDKIIAGAVRILKPGGRLEVTVPDLEVAAENIMNGCLNTAVQGMLYGDQGNSYWRQPAYGGEDESGRFLSHSYQHNHHKAGFTKNTLGKLFVNAGLVDVEGERRGIELYIQGIKPLGTEVPEPTSGGAELSPQFQSSAQGSSAGDEVPPLVIDGETNAEEKDHANSNV